MCIKMTCCYWNQLMDRRHFRAFSRADEYLYAMKEDLAEWLNMLYPNIAIEAETFMDKLENGEYLVKVRQPTSDFEFCLGYTCSVVKNITKTNFVRDIRILLLKISLKTSRSFYVFFPGKKKRELRPPNLMREFLPYGRLYFSPVFGQHQQMDLADS